MAKSTEITYFPTATARCLNCGSIYTLGMTQETLTVEVCGNCHPFYTQQDTLVDTAGRIEKFQARLSKATSSVKKASSKARKFKQSLADMVPEPVEKNEEEQVVDKEA
jgi:large subunit ribosomal protein L31